MRHLIAGIVAGLMGLAVLNPVPTAEAAESTCNVLPTVNLESDVSSGSIAYSCAGEDLAVRVSAREFGVSEEGLNKCASSDGTIRWELSVYWPRCGSQTITSGVTTIETTQAVPGDTVFDGVVRVPKTCPPGSTYGEGKEIGRGAAFVYFAFGEVGDDGLVKSASRNFKVYTGAPSFLYPDGQNVGPQSSAGFQADPVNSATGAFTHAETDLQVAARAVNLDFWRSYDSSNDRDSGMGVGWTHAYGDRLEIDPGETATWVNSYGASTMFDASFSGGWRDPDLGSASLTDREDGGYDLLTADEWTMAFSGGGDLQSVTDRNGVVVEVEHDDDDRVSAIRTSARALELIYQADHVVSVVARGDDEAVAASSTYEYDGAGHLTRATLPDGESIVYGYDANGLTSLRNSAAQTPQLITEYGDDGRVVAQEDGNANRSTWAWDAEASTSTMTDPGGGEWTDTYQRGWLVSRTDPAGAVTQFDWDDDGQLLRTVAADGSSTGFLYNRDHRLTNRVSGGFSETTTYDFGQLTPRDLTDAIDRTTTFSYDDNRNVLGIEPPQDGADASFGYSPGTFDLASAGLGGDASSFDYEGPTGDLVAATTPVGNITTWGRGSLGLPTSVTTPSGSTTQFERDVSGRVTSITTEPGHVTGFSYDAFGRVESRTDANGQTTAYVYDNAGNVSSVTPPGGAAPTTYEYDALNQVSAMTNARGDRTEFSYDAAGRLVEVDQSGRAWSFTYDELGRRTSVVAPSGRTTSLDWGEHSLLSSVSYSDGTAGVSFEYDEAGRRTSMTDGLGTQTYEYDGLDRPVKIARGDDVWTYAWNARGLMTERTAPHQDTQTFEYDADGRLVEVNRGGSVLATYAYDTATSTTSRTQPNGIVTRTVLDDEGRLASVVETDADGDEIGRTTYVYDGNGNPVTVTRDGDVSTNTFDAQNRLVRACAGASCDGAAGDVEYTYDEVGNIVAESTPDAEKTYTYDAYEQLVSVESSEGVETYGYDDDGNRVSGPAGSQQVNAAGQVTATTAPDGSTTSFSYDGNGQLSTMSDGEATTSLDYDPVSSQLVGERQETTVIRAYSYGRELLAVRQADQVSHYSTDELGSVRTVRGPTGVLERSYEYGPYGDLTDQQATQGAPANPLMFTGGLSLDDDGASYRFGVRTYDVGSRAFTTPDQGGTGEPYRYASANPAVFTDQLGLYSFDNFLQDVNQVSGWVSNGAAVVAIGCAAAVVCAPLAPLAGSISAVGAVVNVASGTYLAGENCLAGKGSCAATVGLAATSLLASKFGAGRLLSAAPLGTAAKSGDDALRAARAARDVKAAEVGRSKATVTGGYGRDGVPVAGCNRNPIGCAEDDVARQIGGDPSDINFTEAIRPRTGEQVPICARCQGTYDQSQFPSGTLFDPNGLWGRR